MSRPFYECTFLMLLGTSPWSGVAGLNSKGGFKGLFFFRGRQWTWYSFDVDS